MLIWEAASMLEEAHRLPGDTALSVNGLSAGYGSVQILKRVTLSVGRGEVVGILGRNGAGKTTLLKAIIGIVTPTSGEITINGTISLNGQSTADVVWTGIGYVPQGRAIFPALSGLENLRVAQYALKLNGRAVDAMIEEFPALKPKLNARGGSLSGGQQQILALARALVGSPSVLLLDEPSEGIQPSILDDIVEILTRFAKDSSLSILLVEQNIEFAAALAQRAYVMDMGNILSDVSKAELKSRQLARDLMSST
jgi:ABC-type branched-subunit amino acid transport system ATPase component